MRILIIVLLFLSAEVRAVEWTSLWIQPGIARDLAMGNATGAMYGSMSAGSGNPAGFVPFPPEVRTGLSGVIQANGIPQIGHYFETVGDRRTTVSQAEDVAGLLIRSVSGRHRWAAVSAILAEPVMRRDDSTRFDEATDHHTLAEYQTSLLVHVLLHPRVQLGGRVDFYSRDFKGDGEGFSYGVVLKPRGVQVGLHYQRYPVTGPRWLHPLDRRVDQGTTASVALQRPNYSVAFQLNNLSESDQMGFLEPRAGAEWRPIRSVALRAGGSVFTRSRKSIATFGIGLIDANWFRSRENRLRIPEDVLSAAMAVLYDGGRPVHYYTALTLAWRL